MPTNLHQIKQPAPTPLDSRWRWVTALGCATGSLGLYALLPTVAAGLAVAEPSYAGEVFRWVTIHSRQSLTALHESGSTGAASMRFLGLCAGLFVLYAVMLKLVKDRQSLAVETLIFVAGALFLFVHLFAPVLLSSDVYYYALYGRVVSVYHANPYAAAPPISANDPFAPLCVAQGYLPSWYGPLWTLISAGLALVTGERLGLTVLVYRLLAIGAAMAAAALLWSSLRGWAPERAAQGLVMFLWNPLVVLETGLSAHNDSLMLALVLLGVWLHLRGWKTGAVVALTLSALIKFLTGMLIPLYFWLVLRQAATWRERISFLARSGVAVGLVWIAVAAPSKSNYGSPVSEAALASNFYENNFHELLLKGLRYALGEDADSVRSPIYFQGWWLAAESNSVLRAQPDDKAAIRQQIPRGARVIVIAPQRSDRWVRAYDPASRDRGYVDTDVFTYSTRPANANAGAILFETVTTQRPPMLRANRILRAALWLGFAAFGLLCAWRTTTFEEFVVWSAAALLASYYLIITEIWPWYVNWAVALGALATTRRPARFATLLSAGVLTLYVTIGYQTGEANWIFALRSLPAFVLPLVLFVVLYCRRNEPAADRDSQ